MHYAVIMSGEDANGFHWITRTGGLDRNSTGESSSKDEHVWLHPLSGSGERHYRLEDFALNEADDGKTPKPAISAPCRVREISRCYCNKLNCHNEVPRLLGSRAAFDGPESRCESSEKVAALPDG